MDFVFIIGCVVVVNKVWSLEILFSFGGDLVFS